MGAPRAGGSGILPAVARSQPRSHPEHPDLVRGRRGTWRGLSAASEPTVGPAAAVELVPRSLARPKTFIHFLVGRLSEGESRRLARYWWLPEAPAVAVVVRCRT